MIKHVDADFRFSRRVTLNVLFTSNFSLTSNLLIRRRHIAVTSSAMQRLRNYVVPYGIYLFLLWLSPAPFQSWLDNLFPGAQFNSIDLKKPLVPLILAVATHYLFYDLRRKINKPNFDRISELILKRFQTEFGSEYDSWARIRPAFYNAIDNDKSLTHLSDRIKNNGIVWVGFADLQLASILTAVVWMLGGAASYHFNYSNYNSWIYSSLYSMVLFVVAAFGSHITTASHQRLVGEQLDQMFPLHRDAVMADLQKGRQ